MYTYAFNGVPFSFWSKSMPFENTWWRREWKRASDWLHHWHWSSYWNSVGSLTVAFDIITNQYFAHTVPRCHHRMDDSIIAPNANKSPWRFDTKRQQTEKKNWQKIKKRNPTLRRTQIIKKIITSIEGPFMSYFMGCYTF